MNKLKILMPASTFPRWRSDTEPRFIFDFAKAVSKYCDVTVLVPAYPGARDFDEWDNVKIIRYHYMPFKKHETLCYPGAIMSRIKAEKKLLLEIPFLFLGLWRALHQHQREFDIVHVHWFIPQGLVQTFVRRNYIITGHGDDVTLLNQGVFRVLKQIVVNRAGHIVVVSNRLKKILVDNYKITEKRLSVISMGCDINRFSPINRDSKIFSNSDRKKILFVGRLVERKGVHFLIDAMDFLDSDKYELYIVGTGVLEEDLKLYAKQKKSHVTFLGAKTHDELPALYASADVCVVPSINEKNGAEEGLGIVILESMASGTPVIASNAGGITDVIQDSINGLLAKPANSSDIADKIKKLFNDSILKDHIVEEGIKTAQKYSYDSIAQRYFRLYTALNKKMRNK